MRRLSTIELVGLRNLRDVGRNVRVFGGNPRFPACREPATTLEMVHQLRIEWRRRSRFYRALSC